METTLEPQNPSCNNLKNNHQRQPNMIRKISSTLATITAALAITATDAQANPSCIVTPIARLHAETIAGVPIIIAAVNGQPVKLALDTASQQTLLTNSGAQKLRLPPDKEHISSTVSINATGTPRWNYDARIDTLSIGETTFRPQHIHITDQYASATMNNAVSGAIGLDILSQYEIEIEMNPEKQTGSVNLYTAYGCSDDFVPWTGHHDTLPMSHPTQDSHVIIIPTAINKTPQPGILDTASTNTMISQDIIDQNQIKKQTIIGDDTIDGSGQHLSTWSQTIQQMQIGEELFNQPTVSICACSLPNAPVLIGEDYIGPRKIWISNATQQVFVKYQDRKVDTQYQSQ